MPVKVMLPVVDADHPPEVVKLGPMVLMSGFMTKKTRSLKWKQRWWQLMDNGFLHYYRSDDHPQKPLGKIDVGKTCYEVKLGAELCYVKFPRAVPSCCCLCFAVLNRTFNVYTPTPDEAQNWARAINGLSEVINRKVVAGLERRQAPSIPGMCGSFSESMQVRVTRVRLKGSQSGLCDSYQDISQVHYLSIENKILASKTSKTISVPSSLDKMSNHEGRGSELSSYGFFLKNNTPLSSEIPQEQQLETVVVEEVQEARNIGPHSSLPHSFMWEHLLPGNIEQVPQQQQDDQEEQMNVLQINELKQQSCHRSRSMEDVSSPRHTACCNQPEILTQLKPVPKPRKQKGTRNYLDKVKNRLEYLAQKTSENEMTEERPTLPSSSPPPSDLPPLTTCPRVLPRQKKHSITFPFSPPLSPPPPPPSQQNNVDENAFPTLPLSSPPSSSPVQALSSSVPSHPEKPFLPPRPVTEIEMAPFSSPPRPRKKTMTKPRPKPRSKNNQHS